MTRSLVGAGLCAVLALSGCSKGAKVTVGDGKGSPFCTDVGSFQTQATALEAAATQDLATLQQQSNATRDLLIKLQSEANAADKVNGHSVKDDLQTAVNTYKELASQLGAADPKDPNAIAKALAAVQSKEGAAFTSATNRLDAYTKQVCGISVSSVTTTAAPTTTAPIAPVGPGLTPTTAGATATSSVTSAPSTTSVPASTGASSSTTSTP